MIMKRLLHLVVIFFYILSIYSCNRSVKEIETNYLVNALNKIKIDETINWIVILPGLGCDGCIQEGEAFMKKCINNKEIMFVLTNISSLKIMEQKIEVKVHEHQNIIIDRGNEFIVPTNNSIYPCIIKIENNKIVSHEFQSPENGLAFSTLKQQIKSE